MSSWKDLSQVLEQHKRNRLLKSAKSPHKGDDGGKNVVNSHGKTAVLDGDRGIKFSKNKQKNKAGSGSSESANKFNNVTKEKGKGSSNKIGVSEGGKKIPSKDPTKKPVGRTIFHKGSSLRTVDKHEQDREEENHLKSNIPLVFDGGAVSQGAESAPNLDGRERASQTVRFSEIQPTKRPRGSRGLWRRLLSKSDNSLTGHCSASGSKEGGLPAGAASTLDVRVGAFKNCDPPVSYFSNNNNLGSGGGNYSEPPPPIPPHHGMPAPPNQPLPPLPHQQHHLTAPGTCTLPRRGLSRDPSASKVRSPSNPPPANRQPLPANYQPGPSNGQSTNAQYQVDSMGRYQSPPYMRQDVVNHHNSNGYVQTGAQPGFEQDFGSSNTRSRIYQPPPPPNIHSSQVINHGSRYDLNNLREPVQQPSREYRVPPTDYDGNRNENCSGDNRFNQEVYGFPNNNQPFLSGETHTQGNVPLINHTLQIVPNFPMNSQSRCNYQVPPQSKIIEQHQQQIASWHGNANQSLADNGQSKWIHRDQDSGFDSIGSRIGDSGPRSLNIPSGSIETSILVPSKSTEDLLIATQMANEANQFRKPFSNSQCLQTNSLKPYRDQYCPSPSSVSQILPSDCVYPQNSNTCRVGQPQGGKFQTQPDGIRYGTLPNTVGNGIGDTSPLEARELRYEDLMCDEEPLNNPNFQQHILRNSFQNHQVVNGHVPNPGSCSNANKYHSQISPRKTNNYPANGLQTNVEQINGTKGTQLMDEEIREYRKDSVADSVLHIQESSDQRQPLQHSKSFRGAESQNGLYAARQAILTRGRDVRNSKDIIQGSITSQSYFSQQDVRQPNGYRSEHRESINAPITTVSNSVDQRGIPPIIMNGTRGFHENEASMRNPISHQNMPENQSNFRTRSSQNNTNASNNTNRNEEATLQNDTSNYYRNQSANQPKIDRHLDDRLSHTRSTNGDPRNDGLTVRDRPSSSYFSSTDVVPSVGRIMDGDTGRSRPRTMSGREEGRIADPREQRSAHGDNRSPGAEGGARTIVKATPVSEARNTSPNSNPQHQQSSSSTSWMEWTQQLKAYVAWVNSQLRKKGLPLISDLRRDLQSGVVFADLIEIIAGERVAGIQRNPTEHPQQMMRDNIDRILQFMAAKRIRMAHITSKDVIEGNLKSIMRVILALAAHYKPQSVRCPPQSPQIHVDQKNQNIQVGPGLDTTSAASSSQSSPAGSPSKQNGGGDFNRGGSGRFANSESQELLGEKDSRGASRGGQCNKSVSRVPVRLPTTSQDSKSGSDAPLQSAPDKTPNLSAHRRALVSSAEDDPQTSAPAPGTPGTLRRQPSLTCSTGIPRPCSPVYENLPRRAGAGAGRWAYDSLRASHKFQWSSRSKTGGGGVNGGVMQSTRTIPPDVPPKPILHDSSMEDTVNSTFNTSLATTSLNTSLNTSIETDVDAGDSFLFPLGVNKDPSNNLTVKDDRRLKVGDSRSSSASRDVDGYLGDSDGGSSRPAALTFWQELQNPSRGDGGSRSGSAGGDDVATPPCSELTDADSPFRFHTIHRMSGRRKLPQIPTGQSPSVGGGSGRSSVTRGSTPQGGQTDTGQNSPRTSAPDEASSREPEGRSQNSSPATSVSQGPTVQAWPQLCLSGREEAIKDVLMNLKNTRDQLLALRSLDGTLTQDMGGRLGGPAGCLEGESWGENRSSAPSSRTPRAGSAGTAAPHSKEGTRGSPQSGRVSSSTASLPSAGGRAAREELHLVREAIGALRTNFRSTDPNQHILDTLEQAIAILMEKNSSSGVGGTGTGGGDPASFDTLGSAGDTRLNSSDPQTKVIYFTERTVTPFMSTIAKALGDVRLRDFKVMFDRPGLHRYHFKNYDPEYGMVKEEILNDEDILPGVDGKIIAWVEEDHE